MAVGDILAIVINADGYTADITVEGMAAGGSYDFGFDATLKLPSNQVVSPKISFIVQSNGYTSTGVYDEGGVGREIYVTEVLRKVSPNEADNDETVSGTDLIIKVTLSENIYLSETVQFCFVSEAFYDDGTNTSNSNESLSVTNNSALNFPKVVGNWAWPGSSLVTGDFDVAFSTFSGFAENRQQVACVKFTATDQHSNSVEYIVTEMTIQDLGEPNVVQVYKATINTSTLTDGDVLTVKAVAYPLIGNSASVLDTDDGVNTMPTVLYTNQTYRLDKSNKHGHVVVDLINGNDGTGAVYSSQSLAEAGNAYATISAALTALQAYHNTNAGHNDAGGGTVYLPEGIYPFSNWQGGTLTQWVTFKPTSTSDKANVIVSVSGTMYIPTYVKFDGVKLSGSGTINGEGTKSCWPHDCELALTGGTPFYRFPYNHCTLCTGDASNIFSDAYPQIISWGIARGNNLDTYHAAVTVATLLGNNKLMPTSRTNDATYNNNRIAAFNTYYNNQINTGSVSLFDALNVDGLAIVQNIVETSNSSQPIIRISGDGSTNATNNIILFNNTFVGQRANMAYNDIVSGGPYPQTNWFVKNNFFRSWNNKDDTHTGNTDATGGWPVGYHVNSRGNVLCRSEDASGTWLGEFWGLDVVAGTIGDPVIPAFVDNASQDGTTLGNGDYRPVAGSVLINLTSDELMPYDIEGNDRSVSHVVGAYCFSQSFNNGNIFYRMLNNV